MMRQVRHNIAVAKAQSSKTSRKRSSRSYWQLFSTAGCIGTIAMTAVYVASCATMPQVTASYYFPRAETRIVVTQTLGCDAKEEIIVSATDVAATTTYSADPNRYATLDYAKYGGEAKDADVSISLTPDGRLSGVNSTITGEGTSIIKGVTTVAAAAAASVYLRSAPVPGRPGPDEIKRNCDAISKFAGAKSGGDPKALKVATLTYSANLLYSSLGNEIHPDLDSSPAYSRAGQTCQDAEAEQGSPCLTLLPDTDSEELYQALTVIHDKVRIRDQSADSAIDAAHLEGSSKEWEDNAKKPSGYELLKLNRTATAKLVVYGPNMNFTQSTPVWRGEVQVPIASYYALPVPSGVTFGKQQFALALSDPGSIIKLEYATNTGVPDVVNAAGAIAGALPTTAKNASEIQAQSDLIYQQQRLVLCKTTPSSCPSK